jgi:hypothetical protein
MQTTKSINRNSLNLWIDLGVFSAFLAATAPHFTGIAIHEWLGLALGAGLFTHLLLHWSWVAAVTRRFFGATTWRARLNYVLNALLFVAFTVIIVTGLMMSEEVLPLIGITAAHGGVSKMLHSLATNVTLGLTGLHVALHWPWIVNMVGRLFTRRPARRPAQRPAPTLAKTHQEA